MWSDFCPKSLGGRITKRMEDFNTLILESGLKDIELFGVNFTWSNFTDKFLFLPEWEEIVSCVKQPTWPRVTSDHYPIILDSNVRSGDLYRQNSRMCGSVIINLKAVLKSGGEKSSLKASRGTNS